MRRHVAIIRDSFLYSLSIVDVQVVTAQDGDDLAYILRKLEQEYTKIGNKQDNITRTIKNLENDKNKKIQGTELFK